VDDGTLLIASSDLSHYHPYAEAKRLDGACVEAICALDVPRMERQGACGKGPILALLRLARLRGWQARLLDQRTSGDQGADKKAVVGYAAIAFYESAAKHALAEGGLSPAEQAFLLDLARRSLRAATRGEPPPPVDRRALGPRLLEPRGCFVTLTLKGALRGCLGRLAPSEPLWRAVRDNARAAALRDSRFPPVKAAEAEQVGVEVSVLTVPRPLAFVSPEDLLRQLRPGQDGVVLRKGPLEATFLPQVWKELPDRRAFLTELSLKAGGPGTLWREPGLEVEVYSVEAFP
jgi:AmmeMemoRadiSam system protein A